MADFGFREWREAANAGMRAARSVSRNVDLARQNAERNRQLHTANARSLLGSGRSRPQSWSGIGRTVTRGVLREIGGPVIGQFADDVSRYARGGAAGGLFGKLLAELGPVGKALGYLFGRESARSNDVNHASVRSAIELLQGLGYNVTPPGAGSGSTGGGAPGAGRGSGRAPSNIPTGSGGRGGGGSQTPPRGGGSGAGGQGSTSSGVPFVQPGGNYGPNLPQGRFVADQYIPMQLVQSSNVYAIGYNPDTRTCRVQFLATAVFSDALKGKGHRGKKRVKGKLGRTVSNKRSGPGPVYDYKNVPPGVWRRLEAAGSKGKAIWDNLRIRGTVWGHKFDYTLSAASVVDVVERTYSQQRQSVAGKRVGRLTYVPRRATGPGQFFGRTMLQGVGVQARQFRSILPNQRIK